MLVIESAVLGKRPAARSVGMDATFRTATLTALVQRNSSGYSREFIRHGVLSWAAGKWPELGIARDACEGGFAAESPSARVQITCASKGEYAWTFKGTDADPSGRVWETCVLVQGGEDHDLLAVRTGYAGSSTVAPFCAQPKFLCPLIEHLPFDDGGYPVGSQPREVSSHAAFDNFRDHLLSPRRTLPILAVASVTEPRAPASSSPNPRVLSRALCGVAHVVWLAGVGVSRLEELLGSRLGVRSGEARLYKPGLGAGAVPEDHPAFVNPRAPSHPEPGRIEGAAQRAAHSWSTSPARRDDFAFLWGRSGRA